MSGAVESMSGRAEMIHQCANLGLPERRAAAIEALSGLLGIATFIVLLPDPEIGTLLAANGFAQTFPDGRAWRAFIETTRARSQHKATLPWPTAATQAPACGVSRSGFVLVMVGGNPNPETVEEFTQLIGLLMPGFAHERAMLSHTVQMELARRTAEEASSLAQGLDRARQEAQREISARKTAEAALRETKEKLAQINQELEVRVQQRTEQLRETIAELEAFSYSVSHDMRAPLRAMHSYANALIEEAGDKLAPVELEYISRIVRAAQRLDRLILDVLQYSRVARTAFLVEPLDLNRVVADVIQQYPMLHSGGADVAILSPLPHVLAHEVLLVQCLSNLLTNAVKFVPAGVRPRVSIRAEEKDRLVRLWIEDNGIGIEPRHRQKIFGIFERINPDTRFEGTGIGLAIVQRAVQRLGGDVGVESEPGQGSRFWLTLPRAP